MGSRLKLLGECLRHVQYLKNSGALRWKPGAVDDNYSRYALTEVLSNLEKLNISEFKNAFSNTEKMLEMLEKYGNDDKISSKDGDRLDNYSKKTRGLILKYFENYAEDPSESEGFREDVFSEKIKYIISLLEKEKETDIKFIESSPEKRDLEGTINAMIQKLSEKDEICFTGYFDQQLLSLLFEAMKKKSIKVKIICPSIEGRGRENKSNKYALEKIMGKGGLVRINDLMHARIVLTNNEILVGSADMKANSFGGKHYEASLWSNNPVIIQKVKNFLKKIWEESQDPNWESKQKRGGTSNE